MSKKVVLRPTVSSTHRRQPLLRQSKSSGRAVTQLGEAVGGAAAVCCCCPFGLANLMYLAIYKVPASLCQRALKKTKQRRRRHHLPTAGEEVVFPQTRRCTCACCDDFSARVYPACGSLDDVAGMMGSGLEEKEDNKELMELEKEMWDRFYSTGFWRSPSQRDDSFLSSTTQSQVSSVSNLQVLAV
ncbi:uncharacterized protein LOC130719273 [Lotus japonicus]|uniref:uncharacterized protein LOC130719273 n=1 Tax=Lotus japonicus TaxID=34305 RepID=UPI00258907D5|nr:uncharacterized protein LOC130719273 [Lotus japonicus]